ncbi:MAG: PTS sugar transporter subunit IIB [Gemmatimonadota bacterium]|nr:PTS sugar transporter subunit IIB [Gemmatimonadota bacterium]
MSIALIRVDERLVHGQVVVGWGGLLGAAHYAVVDDELVHSRWEQELYELALPAGAELRFASVQAAAALVAEWDGEDVPAIVLVRDLATARAAAERDAWGGRPVNLGGQHAAPGRRSVLPYLHLSETDLDDLAWLAEHEADVYAQDVPGGTRIKADQILKKGAAAWNR